MPTYPSFGCFDRSRSSSSLRSTDRDLWSLRLALPYMTRAPSFARCLPDSAEFRAIRANRAISGRFLKMRRSRMPQDASGRPWSTLDTPDFRADRPGGRGCGRRVGAGGPPPWFSAGCRLSRLLSAATTWMQTVGRGASRVLGVAAMRRRRWRPEKGRTTLRRRNPLSPGFGAVLVRASAVGRGRVDRCGGWGLSGRLYPISRRSQ